MSERKKAACIAVLRKRKEEGEAENLVDLT
jgi:hypothetical protein